MLLWHWEGYLSNFKESIILSHLRSSLLHPIIILSSNLLTEAHLVTESKRAIFVKTSSDSE